MGYIYILKNPSFPDYIKIGYADDVEERVRQLNRSECTPFAFRIYATYEVSSRLMDKQIHSIIDRLNPSLRSIDEYNGQKRVREFYAMTAEEAYFLFESIAAVNDCTDKLVKYNVSEESKREEIVAENVAEEISYHKKERAANYGFDGLNIPVGAMLVYRNDPNVVCTIADNRRLSYRGKLMYMTPFAQLVSGKKYITNGPGWVVRNFEYNGKLMIDYEKEDE